MRVLVRRMKIATTINVFFLYPQNDFLLGEWDGVGAIE